MGTTSIPTLRETCFPENLHQVVIEPDGRGHSYMKAPHSIIILPRWGQGRIQDLKKEGAQVARGQVFGHI